MGLTVDQYRSLFVQKTRALDEVTFARLLKLAEKTKESIEQLLLERSYTNEMQYLAMLSELFQVPSTGLYINQIDPQLLALLPEDVARQHLAILFDNQDGKFCVAVTNPHDEQLLAVIRERTGQNVQIFVSTEARIKRALLLYGGDVNQQVQQVAEELSRADTQAIKDDVEAEAVAPLLDRIIETALFWGASDVHIEPFELQVLIRLRVEGKLRTLVSLPATFSDSLPVRIKALAKLQIDESREPQDGRFAVDSNGDHTSIRVSTLPSTWGEKIVLRLLPKRQNLLNPANLGLLPIDLHKIKDYLDKPNGMIVVTGSTNSGKSTTLYSLLREISIDKTDTVNITTLEDPVEYTMPGVTQVQVSPQLTFSAGLRTMLRQDLDILMIGEIRDNETAEFAMRAALLGRQIFSTLHTNDAPSVIPRLLDMQVAPYMIASTLKLVIAQRLLPKLCEACRQPAAVNDQIRVRLEKDYALPQILRSLVERQIVQGIDPSAMPTFYTAAGCATCDQTGHVGRVGIFELLEMNQALRETVYEGLDSGKIYEVARQQGMKTLFEDAIAKAVIGSVSLEDALTIFHAD